MKLVNNRSADLVAAARSADPKIKLSQIQGNAILTAIQKCKSWNEVEKLLNRSPINTQFRMRRLSKDNRHYLMEKVMKL